MLTFLLVSLGETNSEEGVLCPKLRFSGCIGVLGFTGVNEYFADFDEPFIFDLVGTKDVDRIKESRNLLLADFGTLGSSEASDFEWSWPASIWILEWEGLA